MENGFADESQVGDRRSAHSNLAAATKRRIDRDLKLRLSVRQRHLPATAAANNFVGSMSRKGDCWGTVAESFFASLKKKRVPWRHYQIRAEAQRDILDYIVMFYNSRRLHSTLGCTSLNDYESDVVELKKSAN